MSNETPADLFDNPDHRHPRFEEVASRDYFAILRGSMGAKVRMPGGKTMSAQFFAVQDVASTKLLGGLPLERETSTVAATDLIPLLEEVLATTGKPRKGWLVSYSVWFSLYDLLEDETAALRQRGLEFQRHQVSFGRMPLAERVALEEWISSRGMVCTFNEELLYGRPRVSAVLSEGLLDRDRN